MAFTERYVTTSGSGANGGTNDTSDAWDWQTGMTSLGAGIRPNVKAGTYNNVIAYGTLFTAVFNNPASIRGYSSTPGDGYLGRDSEGKLITTNMPVINYDAGETGDIEPFCIFENIVYNFNADAAALTLSSGAIFKCVINNSSTGSSAACAALSGGTILADSDVSLTGASGGLRAVTITSTSCRVYGSRITGKNTVAIRSTQASVIVGCTIFDSTIGVEMTNTGGTINSLIADCTFYNCSTACIQTPSSALIPGYAVINCHGTDSNRFINNSNGGALPIYTYRNRTRDNTNADAARGNYPDMDYITTDNGSASSDYIDTTNKNFILRPTAVGRTKGVMRNRDIGGPQAPSAANFGAAG